MSGDMESRLDRLEAELRETNESLHETNESLREAKNHYGREIARDRQRIAALEDENEALRETVQEERTRRLKLENQVYDPIERKEYEELARREKVATIQNELIDRATAQEQMSGRAEAKFTCNDVQLLFDGMATARHCYDLMREAGAKTGYQYHEPAGQKNPNYVKVDLDVLRTEGGVDAIRTTADGESR